MIDGELSADETKFLLRRMEHDDALADSWQRWQFVGDALRGQVDRVLPADFSHRVGRAIADDLAAEAANDMPLAVAAHGNARGPLLRWGGGAALAASVALAALIGTRMWSVPDGKTTAAAATASIDAPTPVPVGAGIEPQPIAPSVTESPVAEAGAAIVLAAVSTGISSGDRRGSRPRILAREEAIAASTALTAKAAAVAGTEATSKAAKLVASAEPRTKTADAVVAQAEITPKPWPRALVPGASGAGDVTAGFEGSPVLHTFQPHQDPLAPRVARPFDPAASPP